MPHLSDHDLRQFDDAYLERLSLEQARALLGRALEDLKTARERLAQNPSNSSRPPSSRAPWEGRDDREESPGQTPAEAESAAGEAEEAPTEAPEEDAETSSPGPTPRRRPSGRRPGRRPGGKGHSRTQQLPVDVEQSHAPSGCAGCGQPLSEAHPSRAHTARYELELIQPGAGGTGLLLQQTKHTYLERQCDCGHWTRAEPGRCEDEADWAVGLSEWHLAGPVLVAFICALTQRMRLSRAKVQEFLFDWLGLVLSTATINQCVHEAGRALEPVVEAEIRAAVHDAEVLYADETSWKEHAKGLWLWVFTCTTATLFVVGRRTREVVEQVLGAHFTHWLMSDGYGAYRHLEQRLRCLAHIIRKAKGLEESFNREAQRFGTQLQDVIATLIEAVYAVRGGDPPPEGGLRAAHAPLLNALLETCLGLVDSPHEKTRALARELLNDWDSFWVVLDHPELPLTNNEAERALRHWVIARRISLGTRTPQGTRAFALIASVIETCRKRQASPWTYIAEVLRQRRKGLPAPALPQPAVA